MLGGRRCRETRSELESAQSLSPPAVSSVPVPRGAQCGRKDGGALWTRRGVSWCLWACTCVLGGPPCVGRRGRWWRGALLGAGPRLLAPDSAPSGRVAVYVPPCRAWPPAVRKASEGSVLKFHSIMCSALSPKADCYSSRRGGNSPGLWQLPSAIKY